MHFPISRNLREGNVYYAGKPPEFPSGNITATSACVEGSMWPGKCSTRRISAADVLCSEDNFYIRLTRHFKLNQSSPESLAAQRYHTCGTFLSVAELKNFTNHGILKIMHRYPSATDIITFFQLIFYWLTWNTTTFEALSNKLKINYHNFETTLLLLKEMTSRTEEFLWFFDINLQE